MLRKEHRIDSPQSLQCQITQTAAHRITDQQRPRKNSRGHRHAERHGKMNPPVMPQASQNEAPRVHVTSREPDRTIQSASADKRLALPPRNKVATTLSAHQAPPAPSPAA